MYESHGQLKTFTYPLHVPLRVNITVHKNTSLGQEPPLSRPDGVVMETELRPRLNVVRPLVYVTSRGTRRVRIFSHVCGVTSVRSMPGSRAL